MVKLNSFTMHDKASMLIISYRKRGPSCTFPRLYSFRKECSSVILRVDRSNCGSKCGSICWSPENGRNETYLCWQLFLEIKLPSFFVWNKVIKFYVWPLHEMKSSYLYLHGRKATINQNVVYTLCNSVIKSCMLSDSGGMNLIFCSGQENV